MNVDAILSGASVLGIDLPTSVTRAHDTVVLLSETDVVPIQLSTPAQLGHVVLAQTAANGAVPDVVRLAREARERTDSVLAHLALEQARELADRRLEQVLKSTSPQIIVASLRPAFDKLIEEARSLPPTVPVNAESAVNSGDGDGVQTYRHLVKLASQMSRLLRLHAELIREDLLTAQAMVFADTRAAAAVGKTIERAGPSQPAPRLMWLASSVGQPWCPTARECSDQWTAFMTARSQPARPHPATVS